MADKGGCSRSGPMVVFRPREDHAPELTFQAGRMATSSMF